MKIPCENCIAYPICASVCQDAIDFMMFLDNHIEKQTKLVLSVNGHKRKHMKEQNRLYYNHLVDGWNKSARHLHKVRARNMNLRGKLFRERC